MKHPGCGCVDASIRRNAVRRISHQDFTQEFPMMVPGGTIKGIQPGMVEIARDSFVSGIFHGDITVKSGANVLMHGIVEGSVRVENGAVLYLLGGIVKGSLNVAGAASVQGIVGNLQADDDATVAFDGIVKERGGSAA
jgi:hypothetical protein